MLWCIIYIKCCYIFFTYFLIFFLGFSQIFMIQLIFYTTFLYSWRRPFFFYLCLTMSAQLMKSKFVHRPSIVRPSVCQLSLNLMHGLLSNFSCGFPWAIRSDFFWIFEKKFFFDFLRIFFVFVNMGPNGSENFKTLLLQIVAKCFETCPEFFSQWSSQNYVRDFWNFEFLITNFFRK